MITVGQIKSDDINRMIKITGEVYLYTFSTWDLKKLKCDHV